MIDVFILVPFTVVANGIFGAINSVEMVTKTRVVRRSKRLPIRITGRRRTLVNFSKHGIRLSTILAGYILIYEELAFCSVLD